MRTTIYLFVLSCLLFACKKDETASATGPTTPVDLNTALLGKWFLISETSSGNYDNSRYKGLPSDYVEFKSDGKAYYSIQGHVGLISRYNLDVTTKTLDFQYVNTIPHFLLTHPCRSTPGCPKVGEIKFISDHLLVIGNTFRDTTNNLINTLTIVDSLTR